HSAPGERRLRRATVAASHGRANYCAGRRFAHRRAAAWAGERAIESGPPRPSASGLPGWHAVRGTALLLAGVLLWPLTRSGYLLGHDLVFTPCQPLDLPALGLSSAAPRAVPLDALVALAGRFLDGAVIGRLAVVLPLVAAGIGVAV